MGHVTANLDQDSYRWRDDDGTETAATWLELVNVSHDFDVQGGNVQARLRFLLQEDGGGSLNNITGTLEFQINGGGYNAIGAATTGCIYFDSGNLTDGNDTTQQLGAGTFITANAGIGEDGVVEGVADFAGNDETEYEYTVEFVAADLGDGDTIDFRVQEADTFTRTASATITKVSTPVTVERTLISNVDAQDLQQAYENKIRALIESLTLTSFTSRSQYYIRELLDSANPRDALLRYITVTVSLRSNPLINDSINIEQLAFRIVQSNVELSDLLIRAIVTEELAIDRILTSSIDLLDQLISTVFNNRKLLSSTNILDVVFRDLLAERLMLDSLQVTDLEIIEKLIYRLLTDTLELSDSVSRLIQGVILSKVLTSTISVFDAVIVGQQITRVLSEVLPIQDKLLSQELLNRNLFNNVEVVDFISSASFSVQSFVLSDQISIEDASQIEKILHKYLVSTVNVIDAIVRNLQLGPQDLTRVLIDNIDILDIIVRIVTSGLQSKILRDNVFVNDTIIKELLQGIQRAELIRSFIEIEPILYEIEIENIYYFIRNIHAS